MYITKNLICQGLHALETTQKTLNQRLSDIGIETRIVELQEMFILYSARILQNNTHKYFNMEVR